MHKHKAKRTDVRPFFGPIEGVSQNRAAHGGVCEVDRCACGAVRRVNINGRHVERGRWRTP